MNKLEIRFDFSIASNKYDRKQQQDESFVVLWRAFEAVIANAPRFVKYETIDRAFSKALDEFPELKRG